LDKSAVAGLSYLIEAAMGNNMPIGVKDSGEEFVYVPVEVRSELFVAAKDLPFERFQYIVLFPLRNSM
jgi:hypothetical protein